MLLTVRRRQQIFGTFTQVHVIVSVNKVSFLFPNDTESRESDFISDVSQLVLQLTVNLNDILLPVELIST